MQANGDLTNGSTSITNAAAGSTGTTVVAGTEMYGATLAAGSITGSSGTVALTSAYTSAGSNAIAFNSLTAANILTATRTNSPAVSGDTTNTSLVTHRLAIDNNTGNGYYTQTITYRVTPAF